MYYKLLLYIRWNSDRPLFLFYFVSPLSTDFKTNKNAYKEQDKKLWKNN